MSDAPDVRKALANLRDCSRRTPDRTAADTADEARTVIEYLSQQLQEAQALADKGVDTAVRLAAERDALREQLQKVRNVLAEIESHAWEEGVAEALRFTRTPPLQESGEGK